MHPLNDVPDQIFAEEMLGPGIALFPSATKEITVVSPTGGLIRSLHPHAFALQVCEYTALLVHLGVNTYRVPEVFKVEVEEGLYVPPLSPISRWDINSTVESGLEPWVTITVMSSKGRPIEIEAMAQNGDKVSPGQNLFQIIS